jgi:methylglutaconyl-CoA hydratase
MGSLTIERRALGVAQVTMSRPEVFNAFDEAMITDLDLAFATLTDEADVRVIVLAGAGKHFSAGADLQWMQRASEATLDWNLQDARRFAAMLARIEACPKPTVARVQGAALGGGVGLACACDVAGASDNTNAVGKRQARRLALTTARIGAAEALTIGLVHQVVRQADLDPSVDAAVRDLLAGGPNAQREIKQLFAQLEVGPITPEVRELTATTIARVRGTGEAREGFAAFLAKRPARWTPER